MTASRDDFRVISSIDNMLCSPEFIKLQGDREDLLNRQLKKILTMTIAELHNQVSPIFQINPYMIGIAYVNQFINKNQNSRSCTADSSRGIYFADVDIFEVVYQWKNQLLDAGHLSGIVFVSDDKMKKSKWFKMLIARKATLIGTDKTEITQEWPQGTQGCAYVVSKRMAVFAINQGAHPSYKGNAEHHQLFTFTITSPSVPKLGVTVTTRNFDDLKSVALVYGYTVGILRKEDKQSKNKNNLVVIALGWLDFETDKILVEVGERLEKAGHRVEHFVFNRKQDLSDILHVFEDKEEWENMFGRVERRKSQQFDPIFVEFANHSATSMPWNFILSPVNAVCYKYDDPEIEPIAITIPLIKRGDPAEKLVDQMEQGSLETLADEQRKKKTKKCTSIEITRKIGSPMSLLELASTVVNIFPN